MRVPTEGIIIFSIVRFEFMPTKCQMLIDFAAIKKKHFLSRSAEENLLTAGLQFQPEHA